MSHLHGVSDADNSFIVDTITREIINNSANKTLVMQYDHNSEVFSFELPRYIEGHDMLNCNRVEVHYLNGTNEGIYLITDLALYPDDETKLKCSWIVSQHATNNVGTLSFLLRFMCISDDVVDYAWSTSIYSGIKISKGIYNSEIVAEQYIDTLKAWENRLEAVENSIGSSGISPIVKVTTLANGHRVEITDANGTKIFDVLNGKNGTNGINGADGSNGVSPTLSVETITGGHRVTITDVNGTQSFDVMDGQDGRDGQNGADGSGVTEERVIELINTELGVIENGTY